MSSFFFQWNAAISYGFGEAVYFIRPLGGAMSHTRPLSFFGVHRPSQNVPFLRIKKSTYKCRCFLRLKRSADYSPSVIAPVGQLSMQARHSTQMSTSTTATPSSLTLMASAGHPASQLPQPTQTLESTTGLAISLLLKIACLKTCVPKTHSPFSTLRRFFFQ